MALRTPSRPLLLAALLCGALGACDQALPPVNRVQPGALEKADLAGDWYYLRTVIDTPYGVAYTFVGEQSLLEKIRWDIDEHYLIARRSYEFVAGSEGAGASGASETGAAVAVYAIESHFDIRRQYNDLTGEESNVVEENDYDRPWYEREYVRVDWSKNLVTEPEFLAIARLWDGMRAEPVAFHVEDPSDPLAPTFEVDRDGRLRYLDVVNRTFVEPASLYFEDFGEVPICWLEYQTHIDCAPGELGVRHSFLRAEPDRDYQPVDYSGDRMERFGYFVNERPGYDPHYGAVESARFRFINRHNLWRESYRRDADGALVRCARDEDCSTTPGSECDGHYARARREPEGACTIPYRDRTVRTLAYHVSEGFPADLLPDARHAVDGWNTAFADTIGSLWELECRDGGGDAESCAAERARASEVSAFVLCENPVADGDPAACGAPGTRARLGDLRYSMLVWVPEPHLGSPLGYGPSSADPETGELIQANAFVYGAGVEELATYARDLVALLNGDLEEAAVASGTNVAAWVRHVQGAAARDARGASIVSLRGADAAGVGRHVARTRTSAGAARRPRSRGAFAEALPEARRAAEAHLPRDGGRGSARVAALRGSAVEELLAVPELRLAAGVGPAAAASPGSAELDRASPLRGRSLGALKALREARRRLQKERCVLRADFADPGLLGLARAIQRSVAEGDGTMTWYGVPYVVRGDDGSIDYGAVRSMLRHPIFDSTAAHEIGHTLGLRHNFSGSYDSLNYAPEYWSLRDDGDMHPRAWDPLSEAEIDGRAREYQYSSVMDYGHNFIVTDTHGLGHYDRAAIKMGYGDLVEVFTAASDPAELAWVGIQQLWQMPAPIATSSYEEGSPITAYTYTQIPALAGGTAALEARADVRYTSLVEEPTLAADGVTDRVVDAEGRPVVPYRFCSDEFVDLSPGCLAYDAGADPEETVRSLIDAYWNYYLFHAFRREQLGFDFDAYWDNIYYRYFSELQYANQDYVWNRAYLDELFAGDPSLDEFYTREDGLGAYTLGVGAAYELFARVLATPEPGGYGRYVRGDGTPGYLLDWYADPDLVLEDLDGRELDSSWNWSAGYYWIDQLERVGFFYDKVLALQTLLDTESYFLGKDVEADARSYAISFHTTFPDVTTALLGGLLAEDWGATAAHSEDGGPLLYPGLDELVSGGLPGDPVDPATGYSVEVYAAVFGMIYGPLAFDHTFLDKARVFVEGGAEGVSLPAGRRVEFTDPLSGVTYLAMSFMEGGVETGLGARMLLHAQALATRGALDELDEYMDVIGLVRTLTWQYGFGL